MKIQSFTDKNGLKIDKHIITGDIIWVTAYDYSYSGIKCISHTPVSKVIFDGTNLLINGKKRLSHKYEHHYFATQDLAVEYYDRQLTAHFKRIAGKISTIISGLKSVEKRITNKSLLKTPIDELHKEIQEFGR